MPARPLKQDVKAADGDARVAADEAIERIGRVLDLLDDDLTPELGALVSGPERCLRDERR